MSVFKWRRLYRRLFVCCFVKYPYVVVIIEARVFINAIEKEKDRDNGRNEYIIGGLTWESRKRK